VLRRPEVNAWTRTLSRLLRRARPAGEPGELILSTAEAATTADLDKAWHGMHYLLTGNVDGGEHPLNFLLSGGAAVGNVEVGYGAARVLTAAQTKQVRDALRSVSDSDVAARFDPTDMTAKDIYPRIWSRPPDQESLAYVMEYLAVLRRFLDNTVGKRLGMVVYLS